MRHPVGWPCISILEHGGSEHNRACFCGDVSHVISTQSVESFFREKSTSSLAAPCPQIKSLFLSSLCRIEFTLCSALREFLDISGGLEIRLMSSAESTLNNWSRESIIIIILDYLLDNHEREPVLP